MASSCPEAASAPPLTHNVDVLTPWSLATTAAWHHTRPLYNVWHTPDSCTRPLDTEVDMRDPAAARSPILPSPLCQAVWRAATSSELLSAATRTAARPRRETHTYIPLPGRMVCTTPPGPPHSHCLLTFCTSVSLCLCLLSRLPPTLPVHSLLLFPRQCLPPNTTPHRRSVSASATALLTHCLPVQLHTLDLFLPPPLPSHMYIPTAAALSLPFRASPSVNRGSSACGCV